MSAVSKFFKQYSKFEPRYIPDCTLWLDGNDTSTNSMTITPTTDNITVWKDKSSSGNNASAVGVPTSGSYNGRLGVYFSGTLIYFTLTPSLLPTGTSSFTVFCVATPLFYSLGTDGMILNWGTSSNPNAFRFWNALSGGGLRQDYFTGSTVNSDSINSFGTASIFSNTSTTSATASFRNGTAFTTNTSTVSYNIGTTFARIGATGTATLPYFGMIHEIIIYNRLLSTTERQQVEGYLGWKWALQTSLPVAHPYYTTIKHGPVLSTFNVTDISGCSLWLDGYDPNKNNVRPANGSSVSIWYDKSGNLNNAIQFVSGTTYPVPTYNLTNRSLSFNSQMYTLTNPITQIGTLFLVGQQTANGNLMSAKDTSGYSPYYIAIKNDTGITLTKADNTLVNFASFASAQVNTTTLITGIVTSTSVTGLFNGGTGTSASYTPPLKQATQTYIGASWFGGTVTVSAASQINEIILFTSALNAYEYQTIEGYLAWKWGLQSSLPSTHRYKNYYPLKIT